MRNANTSNTAAATRISSNFYVGRVNSALGAVLESVAWYGAAGVTDVTDVVHAGEGAAGTMCRVRLGVLPVQLTEEDSQIQEAQPGPTGSPSAPCPNGNSAQMGQGMGPLNPRHVVLARANRAIAAAADVLLEMQAGQAAEQNEGGGKRPRCGTTSTRWQPGLGSDGAEAAPPFSAPRSCTELLLLLTRASWELLLSQDIYLGLHHPERADTLRDLSAGISGLLAMDSPALPVAFPQWETVSRASHMEAAARAEGKRIEALWA
jgi:hypothetical protein